MNLDRLVGLALWSPLEEGFLDSPQATRCLEADLAPRVANSSARKFSSSPGTGVQLPSFTGKQGPSPLLPVPLRTDANSTAPLDTLLVAQLAGARAIATSMEAPIDCTLTAADCCYQDFCNQVLERKAISPSVLQARCSSMHGFSMATVRFEPHQFNSHDLAVPIMSQPRLELSLPPAAALSNRLHALAADLTALADTCGGKTWLDLVASEFVLNDGPATLPPVAMPDIMVKPLYAMPADHNLKPHTISHLQLHLTMPMGRQTNDQSMHLAMQQLQAWLRPQKVHLQPAERSSTAGQIKHLLPSAAGSLLHSFQPRQRTALLAIEAATPGLAEWESQHTEPRRLASAEVQLKQPSGVFNSKRAKVASPAAGLAFFMGLQHPPSDAHTAAAAPSAGPSSDDDAPQASEPELQRDLLTLPATHLALLDRLKAEHDEVLMLASGIDPLLTDSDVDWMSTTRMQQVLEAAAEREKLLPGTQKQLMRTYAAAGVIRQTAISIHQYGIRSMLPLGR